MPVGREIALLGGSFNPPHVAHVMAAWWTLATQGVSEVWLLPSFRHPFGKELAQFEDRVRMCRLATAGLRGVRVSTAEAELAGDPLVGKTARTIEHLRAKYPSRRFALVLGADVLGDTAKWYRFDRVQELARIIVLGRQGYGAEGAATGFAFPEISSSAVRERLRRGEDVSALVPRKVLRYIERRGLYRS